MRRARRRARRPRAFCSVALDDDELYPGTPHVAHNARADAARAADDEVVVELAHFTRAAARAEGGEDFRLHQSLDGARQRVAGGADADDHKEDCEVSARRRERVRRAVADGRHRHHRHVQTVAERPAFDGGEADGAERH